MFTFLGKDTLPINNGIYQFKVLAALTNGTFTHRKKYFVGDSEDALTYAKEYMVHDDIDENWIVLDPNKHYWWWII